MVKPNWTAIAWAVFASLVLTIAATFGDGINRIPYLVVANFVSLAAIAYLYGASQ